MRMRAPGEIVLDLDATDIPLFGHQEGRFFHGYYDNYCYLPLYVFCGRHLLLAKLRRSNIDASAGSVEAIARIVAQIREQWRKVRIVLRADSGFAREALMAWCEANGVDYVFGLARNQRLEAILAEPLAEAARRCAETGKPARLFHEFRYRTLDSWSCERRVVGKAEHTMQGQPALRRHLAEQGKARRSHALRGSLLRPRRGREPHRRAVRALCRARLLGYHAGQPASSLVLGDGLCPPRYAAPRRVAPHPVRRCRRHHDPPQAAQARRAGANQRPPPSLRSCRRLPEPRGVRHGAPLSPARLRLVLSRTATPTSPVQSRRCIAAAAHHFGDCCTSPGLDTQEAAAIADPRPADAPARRRKSENPPHRPTQINAGLRNPG
jgi:hypothetical protein